MYPRPLTDSEVQANFEAKLDRSNPLSLTPTPTPTPTPNPNPNPAPNPNQAKLDNSAPSALDIPSAVEEDGGVDGCSQLFLTLTLPSPTPTPNPNNNPNPDPYSYA